MKTYYVLLIDKIDDHFIEVQSTAKIFTDLQDAKKEYNNTFPFVIFEKEHTFFDYVQLFEFKTELEISEIKNVTDYIEQFKFIANKTFFFEIMDNKQLTYKDLIIKLNKFGFNEELARVRILKDLRFDYDLEYLYLKDCDLEQYREEMLEYVNLDHKLSKKEFVSRAYYYTINYNKECD